MPSQPMIGSITSYISAAIASLSDKLTGRFTAALARRRDLAISRGEAAECVETASVYQFCPAAAQARAIVSAEGFSLFASLTEHRRHLPGCLAVNP